MATFTTVLSLRKPDGTDFVNRVLDINNNLDSIDALFHSSTGHKHTGSGTNGPKVIHAVDHLEGGDDIIALATVSARGLMDIVSKKALTRFVHATTTGAIAVNFDNGLTQDIGSTTGNISLTLSNGQAGQWHALRIAYGGAHTVTFSTAIKWVNGSTPIFTSATGKFDLISLYYDGTNWYGNASLNH